MTLTDLRMIHPIQNDHSLQIAEFAADVFAGGKYVEQFCENYLGNSHYDWDVSRVILDGELPDIPLVPGYTIRSLGDGLELLERGYAAGLGFRQGDINAARSKRDHPDWYLQLQSAPPQGHGMQSGICQRVFSGGNRLIFFRDGIEA